MRMLAACAIVSVFALSLFTSAYAFDSPIITLKSSFVDSEGRLNVVGTVRNYASTPVQVTVGVKTDDGKTVQEQTYGRVVWPLTDSPFKFLLDRGVNTSDPFIMDVKKVEVPNWNNMLVLNYGSMAVGEERAFVGTIKNTAPFDVYNVSVYAGVHSPDHTSQLESVRSNVIPVIKSGEEVEFKAIPDPAIVSDSFFYSCAGIDLDAPIPTINAGNGKFIPFNLNAFAQVSSLRYENATDSIAFGARHYLPDGGQISIKIPQVSQNQTVVVMMDGEPHKASVNGDGKTLTIGFFLPKGDHQVAIQGVRNVPEFPFAALALAAMVGGAIAATRFKAAFKIY